MRDTGLAIADENYFDWPVLPEARALGNPWRRAEDAGMWARIATLPASQRECVDSGAPGAG